MVDIGFGNFIAPGRVIAVVSPESAPIKRLIRENAAAGKVLDCSFGRKTLSAAVFDTGIIALSSLTPDEVRGRTEGQSS